MTPHLKEWTNGNWLIKKQIVQSATVTLYLRCFLEVPRLHVTDAAQMNKMMRCPVRFSKVLKPFWRMNLLWMSQNTTRLLLHGTH